MHHVGGDAATPEMVAAASSFSVGDGQRDMVDLKIPRHAE
jgi:hypothetical protein